MSLDDMKKRNTYKSGFTLLELIVVIGIIAILSLLVLLILNPFVQFQKANDAKRKSDLSQIQRALEQYYQDNGAYPTSSSGHEITNPQLTPVPWGSSWAPYMNVLPKDSDPNKTYVYISTGQSYLLYTSLDRGGADPQACKYTSSTCQQDPTNAANVSCECDGAKLNNVLCSSSGGNICSYGVSSPNTAP